MITKQVTILNELKANKEFLSSKYGIEEIGLFGSYARNEQNNSSDIDIIVKLKEHQFSAIAQLMKLMEERFGKTIHIVTKGRHLSDRFLSRIEKDAIYV